MPYKVVKRNGKWKVINKITGKVYGTHPTRKRAIKQLRALYANAPK